MSAPRLASRIGLCPVGSNTVGTGHPEHRFRIPRWMVYAAIGGDRAAVIGSQSRSIARRGVESAMLAERVTVDQTS